MLQHIVSTHTVNNFRMNQLENQKLKIDIIFKDIDYIIWTGDLPAHDIWNQTKEENLSILKETVAQLLKMFPGIPIFPALGNHEAVPVNRYLYILRYMPVYIYYVLVASIMLKC